MSEVKIEKEYVDGSCIFKVEGSLDTNTSSGAHDIFMDEFAECKDIVINMENLRYLSSSGLRVLLAVLKKSKAVGGSLRLTHLTRDTKKLFDMVGFTEFFTIED